MGSSDCSNRIKAVLDGEEYTYNPKTDSWYDENHLSVSTTMQNRLRKFEAPHKEKKEAYQPPKEQSVSKLNNDAKEKIPWYNQPARNIYTPKPRMLESNASGKLHFDGNAYYAWDYYPKSRFDYGTIAVENAIHSGYILEYKSETLDGISWASKEFARGLRVLMENGIINRNNIWIAAVPSSSQNRSYRYEAAIRNIINMFQDGMYQGKFRLRDGHDIFRRKIDVRKSHMGERLSYDEHYLTIACDAFRIRDDMVVILDDIKTKGTQLSVCTQKLLEKGISEDQIIRLVLGKTVWNG